MGRTDFQARAGLFHSFSIAPPTAKTRVSLDGPVSLQALVGHDGGATDTQPLQVTSI
jgi:hypothetical protein